MKSTKLKTTGLVLMSLGLAIVSTGGVLASAQKGHLGQVLGDSTLLAQLPSTGTSFLPTGTSGATVLSPLFQVNIPAVFADAVTLASLVVEEESVFNGQARFVDEVILENGAELLGNLDANGIDIDVGTGEITASNLVYSVIAGGGIEVSGDQDLTITNTDRGSAQKIFGKIKVGSDTAEAVSNTDTFEFASGDGISLSLNTSDKKLTVTAANQSGWYKASSSNVVLLSNADSVGIGTSSPTNKLEIDSGTDGASGISFTRITSSTAAGVGGGKVLSVDSGGKVILVQDQTGDSATPSAEAVLPSATNGMTLYFNGLNWAASNNLFHDGGSVGISTTSPVSRFHVFTNLATKIGQIIQGYAGQTANLTEWRDSSGSVLSYIDANGVFNGSANVAGSLNPGLTNGSVLFQGASGITQDNSNLFWNDSTNRLGIGTSSPSAPLNVLSTTILSPAIEIGNLSGAYAPQLKINYSSYDYLGTDYYATISHNGINTGVDSLGGMQFVAQAPNGSVHASNNFVFGKKVGTGTPTTLMIIKGQNGNVGIGTTAPAATLSVYPVNNSVDSAIIYAGDSNSVFRTQGRYSAIGYGSTIDSTTTLRINSAGTESTNLVKMQTGQAGRKGLVISGYTSQTANLLEFQDISSTVLSAFNASGNLGIGTSSPGTKLHVYGTSTANLRLEDVTYGSDYAFYTGVNNTDSLGLFDVDAAAYRLLVNSTGLVGIGTTAPTALLHVEGGYGANDAFTVNQTLGGNILSASASGSTKLVLSNGGNLGIGNSAPTGALSFGTSLFSTGKKLALYEGAGGSGLYGFGVTANSLDIYSGGAQIMAVNASGRVGIGTTNPTSSLHVNGNTILAGTDPTASNGVYARLLGSGTFSEMIISSQAYAQLGLYANPQGSDQTGYSGLTYYANSKGIISGGHSGTPFYIGAKGDIRFVDANNNADRLTIKVTTGNIGVGTTAPTAPLHISSGYGANDAFTVNQTLGGNILSASASGSTKFVVTNAGDVGIGTTSPTSKLTVGGDIRMSATSGSLYVGQEGDIYLAGAGAAIYHNTKTIIQPYYNSGYNTAFFSGYDDSSPKLVITSAGSIGVGVGSATPNTYFDISNNPTVAQNTNYGFASISAPQWGGTNDAGSSYSLDFYSPTYTGLWAAETVGARIGFVKEKSWNTASAGEKDAGIAFSTANDGVLAEALRISATGNVGIGTTAPGTTLDVQSTGAAGRFTTTGAAASASLLLETTSGGSVSWTMAHAQSDRSLTISHNSSVGRNFVLKNLASGAESLRVDTNGNIGIGTTTTFAASSFWHGVDITGSTTYQSVVLKNTGTSGREWRLISANSGDAALAGKFVVYDQTSTTARLTIDSSGNVGIGTTAPGTTAANALAIAGSTAPTTSITDGIQLFAVDVAGSHELQVRDEAGNVTTLSPHNFSLLDNQRSEDLAWAFYSERNGLAINADMTKALRVVEKLSGEKLVRIKNLTNGEDLTDFYADQSTQELALDNAEWVTRAELNPFMTWSNDLITFVGKTIFEKPTEFLAEVTFKARVTFSEPDKAGVAVLKAGSTTVAVNFEVPFKQNPVITLTPQNSFAQVTVKDVTANGFTIYLAEPQTSDTEVVWSTISVEQLKRTENTPTDAPTPAQQQPTPSASPSPSPTATGSSSPSPELTPSPATATVSASPAVDEQ